MRQISGSVGLHGVNRKEDVRTIQELLNQVPHAEGGPLKELGEDGLCGRNTNGAIEKLQARKWGWHRVTTKVSPGDATWQLLLSYDHSSQPGSVQVPAVQQPPPELPKQVSRSFSIWIAARPGQLLDAANLYFLITDETNQTKALYYLGNLNPPPPLPQPLTWSLTIPPLLMTNEALGAADWSGDGILKEEGDAKHYTARLWIFPEVLQRHGVQVGLHSSVQTPEKTFSRSALSAPFRLIDSSAAVRAL
jgi:hypothetical protein